MTISDAVLTDLLDKSMGMVPPLQGRLEILDIPGVRARISPVSHPLVNLVSGIRLGPVSVDGVLDRVIETYASRGVPVGWIIGPATTPADLGDRLNRRGFAKVTAMAGLVLTDLDSPIRRNGSVEIAEVTHTDTVKATGMMAASFDLPEDVISVLIDAERLAHSSTCRVYHAFLDGALVSWGLLRYVPGTSVAVLSGAATLEEHRRRGIYSSLVARRVADARADGIEAIIIQAAQNTSAPICRKLGFRELGVLDMYIKSGDEQPAPS